MGWFEEWSGGPRVARLFSGLVGLVMFGSGSKALFAVFTGRPLVASKLATVAASLFFVLSGLGIFLLTIVESLDTTGF